MAFKQGHKKVGGKVKGYTDEAKKKASELIVEAIENQHDKIESAMNELYHTDKATYMKVLSNLLAFVVPKKVVQDTNVNIIEPPQLVVKGKNE